MEQNLKKNASRIKPQNNWGDSKENSVPKPALELRTY